MDTVVSKIPSREAFFKGKGTLEIGYPWLTFGAIIFLENIINEDFNVLEFGSGGSTLFWAEKCKRVKSFETNHEWYNDVKKKVNGFKNVDLVLATESEILKAIENTPNNCYDLILIDSYPKDIERLALTNASAPKVKPNGWIVIDNYLKFGMESFTYPKNWEVYTFDELKYSGRGTRICRVIK